MSFFDWLFGGSKETHVVSSSYNLAGDEEKRPNYLKTVILQNVLSNSKSSISDSITNGYLNGPGIQLRSFFHWSEKYYNSIGIPTGNLSARISINMDTVGQHIPHDSGQTVWAQDGTSGPANYGKWVEQYLLSNDPLELEKNWTADIDKTTNQITLIKENATVISFSPLNFDSAAEYLYIYYSLGNAGTLPGDPASWGPVQLFIYRIGSGITELDSTIQDITSYGQFFPYLPVRIDNNSLSDSYLPDEYELTKKAYKKLTKASLDELISRIESTPDIADIDYAYVVIGVSLNVKENYCKKYLYKFFEKLQASQVGGPTVYTNWLLARAGVTDAAEGWAVWKSAQSNPLDPLYGTPEPNALSILNPTLTGNTIRIANNSNIATNYDVRLYWNYITSGEGVGLGKLDAKKNELWFEYLGQDLFGSQVPAGNPLGLSSIGSIEKVRLYWQKTEETYEYLDIVGLIHHNYIYNNKYVEITAATAIQVATESGFIIPLHYDTLVETNLIASTQMSTACVFVVFNCYQVNEKPWWESGFFQIILVVVIAIIIGITTGGTGIGLLGAAGSLGTSLGFTGITAAIVGSVVNALAAVALTSIISMFANELFGPEIGGIVATVISFMIMQSVTSFHSTGSFAFNFSELMKVDNLMVIMDVVGKSYAAVINGETTKIREETEDYLQRGEDELETIKNKYYDEFGYGIGLVDPLRLTETTRMIVESGDTFLTRTLMTGSDIADMSLAMINDYANLTLNLPNAYS